MASLAQQFTGLRCPPLSSSRLSKKQAKSFTQQKPAVAFPLVSAVAISNAQTRERLKLKELFEEAYERCRTAPMEGVAFTLDSFHNALDKYDFNSELGTKVYPRILYFLSFCSSVSTELRIGNANCYHEAVYLFFLLVQTGN